MEYVHMQLEKVFKSADFYNKSTSGIRNHCKDAKQAMAQ